MMTTLMFPIIIGILCSIVGLYAIVKNKGRLVNTVSKDDSEIISKDSELVLLQKEMFALKDLVEKSLSKNNESIVELVRQMKSNKTQSRTFKDLSVKVDDLIRTKEQKGDSSMERIRIQSPELSPQTTYAVRHVVMEQLYKNIKIVTGTMKNKPIVVQLEKSRMELSGLNRNIVMNLSDEQLNQINNIVVIKGSEKKK
jgi:hypothetical protein